MKEIQLEKFDWKYTMRTNILILKLVGLLPGEDKTYKFDLYTLYTFFSINIFINGHNFFQTMNIFFVYSNLEALTATIFVSLSDVLASIKVYYFVKNMKIFKLLLKRMEEDVFQPNNLEQRALVQPFLNLWNMTYIGFWISASLTLTLWSVYPVLDRTVKEHRLPFAAWYPYDTKKSPLYEITYVYQVISIWFLATANLNMDTIITALMMFIGVQCDILCDSLRNLRPENVSDSFNKNLVACIIHHKEILSFGSKCNEFVNMIVLGQFFTSAVSNGLSMFQLTLVAPLSSECYSLLFFVGSITVQIFLYCWFGNEIELKSRQNLASLFISDIVI